MFLAGQVFYLTSFKLLICFTYQGHGESSWKKQEVTEAVVQDWQSITKENREFVTEYLNLH